MTTHRAVDPRVLPRILLNHVGYDVVGPKRAVVQVDGEPASAAFHVARTVDGEVVLEGTARPAGPVDGWTAGRFLVVDFTSLDAPGLFRLRVDLPDGAVESWPFEVGPRRVASNSVSDIVYYFKGQRHTGDIAEAERRATFAGSRAGTADVHGGWSDATADFSKNLSHLNHATYMNPQQAPLPVWTMLEAARVLDGSGLPAARELRLRLRDEAAFGADALVRMQDPAGYFYEMAVFHRNTRDSIICDWTYNYTREERDSYACGCRQGGGMAVAALARCSTEGAACEFTPDDYLAKSLRGYDHLREHGTEYLNDGRENIIDDYCWLMAASELFNATHQDRFLDDARRRARALAERVCQGHGLNGWLRADEAGERPFFHAAEEGMPVVALLRYREVEPDDAHRREAEETVRRVMGYHLAVTDEVSNPFGYARQLVRSASGGETRSSFFMPHDNETEYWWQGENARLASLAAAAAQTCRLAEPKDPGRLVRFAQAQIDWILGLNPFDSCMLHGRGRNNREYVFSLPNAPGGICNGITAAPGDETDIAFLTGPYGAHHDYTWRWAEQWIPHTGWFLLAAVLLDDVLSPAQTKS